MNTIVRSGLRSVAWKLTYYTSNLTKDGKAVDILHDFYLPALNLAVRYDRVAGYFRSSSLAAASQGYTAFLQHGGKMRLIAGADLQVQDVAAVLAGNHMRLSDTLMEELAHPESWPEDVQSGVSLLATMAAAGQLGLRVGFRRNPETGQALSADSVEDGYVHEKWFVMSDGQGARLSGSGSLNESRTALVLNAENLDVHCDWEGRREFERVEEADQRFEALWNNQNPHLVVLPLPQAVQDRLIHLKDLRDRPTEIDGTVLRVAAEPSLEEMLRFAVLRDAPRMPGGRFIGMYSAPVEPWPHQEIVSRRLVENWPYSYMMCDEVGLGKTIEAALAIRSLILAGYAKRVLIVAPASLTEQWQRELASKAMLSFYISRPKSGGAGKFQHVRIYPDEFEITDGDLYSSSMNIVSSGLVSRKERYDMLCAAAGYDIVLVDESHYARRKNPTYGTSAEPKYGHLYQAMQSELRKKAKSLWLATATPMQIDPIEVYDLFRLTGRVGPYQHDPTLSMRYFEIMAKLVGSEPVNSVSWAMLGQSYRQIEALDPPLWKLLTDSVVTGKNKKVLASLVRQPPKKPDVRYLLQPMFSASPLSRVMMRHTRQLLEIYRDHGELNSNLARRHVRPICIVHFTDSEKRVYDMLESYCSELTQQIRKKNKKSNQMMIFYLNFLQLRFASSLYAIEMTLKRRLSRVEKTLLLSGKDIQSQEEFNLAIEELKESEDDSYSEEDLNDITIDTLLKDRSREDLEWEKQRIKGMLVVLSGMQETPSKIQELLEELDHRVTYGNRLRQTVVFTRFYDSLKSIRGYLMVRNPSLRVGIYAGGKAAYYDSKRNVDADTTREDVKKRFLDGQIDLLLCTDAAAEGLNLQTADLLINFDMGWNPMKIEQRIGRIDRIGQKHKDIEVINMCYLGSTEEVVYGRLVSRLKEANLVVGSQQISMLPVNADDFSKLRNGSLSEKELEEKSIRRIKEQKAATASMEISAKDQYEMYKRMSAKAKQVSCPATVNDYHDAFLNSEYLNSLGAEILDGGIFHIPPTCNRDEFSASMTLEGISDRCPYLSWGNQTADNIVNHICDQIPAYGPIRRISVCHMEIEVVCYLAATQNGIVMIKSISDLEGIKINPAAVISEEQISDSRKKLEEVAKEEYQRLELSRKTLSENKKYADLQRELVNAVAEALFRQEEELGNHMYADALKHLEETRKQLRFVSLPRDKFGKRKSQMLFSVNSQGGDITITVSDILFDCALDLTKRIASNVKSKKTDIQTEYMISRIRGNNR